MIEGVNHITLSVSDLEESFLFYQEILGFKPLAKRKGKSAYFLCGSDWIVLVQTAGHKVEERSYSHLALTVIKENFDPVTKRILDSGANVWQQNSSPGESLYFLDPSGNRLEIHAGSWQSRLQWLQENPSDEVTLYT